MEEKKFDLSHLYIIDLIKNIGQKKNVYAIIYFVLNIVLITLLMQMFEPNFWLCLLYGILIYAVTATIALSPIGEALFRFFNGCKKIEDPEILNRLEPLFMEVKERAQTKHSDFIIEDDIALYIRDDDDLNAFAMGRRTVCINYGLLSLSDEEIKAVLGHEFGHLATHDTDLTLLITVGNFIITALVTFVRLVLAFIHIIGALVSLTAGEDGAIVAIINAISSVISTVAISGLMWAWTQLGVLLVMKSSREAEFEADAFSCDLGYSEGMVSFFRLLQGLERRAKKQDRGNVFAALSASHPDTGARIARITSRATLALEQ